jgi:5-methyltetrahydropteroyltriglutamate--homocysteine methyltransferase
VLIPGCLDSTTNFVEHPELVAERIERFAAIVGQERVIAGTDCGFSTFAGFGAVIPRSPGPSSPLLSRARRWPQNG